MANVISFKKSPLQRLKETLNLYFRGAGVLERLLTGIRNKSVLKSITAISKAEQPGCFSLIEHTGDFIWSVDRDFRFLMCNSTFRELVMEQKGFIPMPGDPVELDYFPGQSAALWLDFYDMAFTGKRFSTETPVDTGGALKTIEHYFSPVLNDRNEIIGVTVVGRDVSLRKVVERETVVAKKRAEEASLAKAEFLSTMSHEIRTPLNAVTGITHLLLRQSPREDQLEYLNTLKFSSENLMMLVNDILDYNKIVEGRLQLEAIAFDLQQLVKGIKHSFMLKAAQKNIDFKVSLDDTIPTLLKSDKTRIAQILNNLIGNAIKFTEKGEVGLKVTLDEVLKNEVVIGFLVYDTGIGIPEDKQAMIFNRFTQAGADTARKFGGTGLGLAITKKLLELLGSKIHVKSNPGKGSKFYFSLRLNKIDNNGYIKKEKDSFKNSHWKSLNGLRVLLVEDNQVNQLVAVEFLKRWNTRFMVASNGKMAINLAQEHDFDLILMDLQMPEMDGYETCRLLKKSKGKMQHIPVIALTANAMQEVRDKIHRAGMTDILTKPIDPDELFGKLSDYAGDQYKEASSNNCFQPRAASKNVINITKLDNIAEGNKQFLKAIIASYMEELSMFKDNYPDIIRNRNLKSYKAAKHKISPSLKLFGAEDLENLIISGEALVTSGNHLAGDQKMHIRVVEKQIEKMMLILRYQQHIN